MDGAAVDLMDKTKKRVPKFEGAKLLYKGTVRYMYHGVNETHRMPSENDD